MRHAAVVGCAAALIVMGAGCGADHSAREMVQPNTQPGKIMMAVGGTAEQLEQNGKISAHYRIKTSDDVEIDVWLVRPELVDATPSGGTVILLHEITQSKADYPYLGTARRLAAKGYTVVLPDLRGHGRSGGQYVTHGAKERHDLKEVADYLLGTGDIATPIYATGAALGGVVAIQYAAIDPRCEGVMAIGPYKDLESLASETMGYRFLSEQEKQAAGDRVEQLAGFRLAEASALEAAAKLTCPLLVAHGPLDLTGHAEAIHAAAAGPKEILNINRFLLLASFEDWYADQIDRLAKTRLR